MNSFIQIDISKHYLRRTHLSVALCLFGGAVRDTDNSVKIKDYDVRVVFPETAGRSADEFIRHLGIQNMLEIVVTLDPFTRKRRYAFTFPFSLFEDHNPVEVDLSIRFLPPGHSKAIALHRIQDSDVELSSIAMTPDGKVWASLGYRKDRDNKTITVKTRDPRGQIYAKRIQEKYPEHTIVLPASL